MFFTLIAERYERRSLGITSYLVFSQWEHIFANPMVTAAAIDRVVHHSVILEFDAPSYRTGVAQKRNQEQVSCATYLPLIKRPFSYRALCEPNLKLASLS